MLIVIAGPSGVGKGTVVKKLLAKMPSLKLSISYTTRKKRINEQDGVDYFFISKEEFEKMDFLEWAEVHGNKYGTANLEYVGDYVFELDVKGASAIKQKINNAITVFLLPPNEQELKRRLKKRNTETEEEIKIRLKTAQQELKKKFDYDYIIVNNDISETVKKIISIIELERKERNE